MARIPRVTQKVFASSLTPSGNVEVFGSLAAGAPIYTNDAAQIMSLSQYLGGFTAGVVGNNSPVKQDLNGLLLMITQQLAEILQDGIPPWVADTPYFIGNFAQDSAGNLYTSVTDNNIGHPLSDTNNWIPYGQTIKGPGICRAWVEFDGINVSGGNAILHSSFNVSTVTKNLAGSYTVNFTNPMPSIHYTFSGSCGSEDTGAYGAGDDGVVVGNVTGQGNAIRNATSCRVFTINTTNKALVSSGDVSVMFFG